VKLEIKEKEEEKGEEEGCMERKVHISNTVKRSRGQDNKKTCRRRNERKQGRIYAHGR
jgi:hypothetical protein